MSSEEPDRSVPDELFRKVSAKPERQLPDALFGGPPPPRKDADPDDAVEGDAATEKGRARPAAEDTRSVPDELFKQKVSARAERQLPDLLFGGPFPSSPVQETEASVPGPAADTELPEGVADSTVESAAAEVASDESAQAQVADAGADLSGTEAAEDSAAVTEAPVAQEVPVDEGVSGALIEEASKTADPAVEVNTAGTGVVDSAATDSVTDSGPVDVAVGDSAPLVTGVAPTGIGKESPASSAVTGAVTEPDSALAEASSVVTGVVAETGPEDAGADVAGNTATENAVSVPARDPASASTGPAADVAKGIALAAADEVSPISAETAAAAPATTADEQGGAVANSPASDALADAGSSAAAVEHAPVPAERSPRPVMIVIADSLSYFGPKGGLPADHPRIWPNLVAAELDWDIELVGRIGWTSRDAYWALIGDPRIWAAVPKASVVVFAVGGMDTLPSPLPTALRELIRYIRPPGLRRVVRNVYTWLQPKLSRLGRPVALPPRLSVDYLEQSRQALTQLRPDLPVIAVLPSVHNCDAYGRVHSGRPRAEKALRAWSAKTSVPLVDLAEAVRENIFSGEANPDGIHWGWDGHTAVANAMVKTLQEVR